MRVAELILVEPDGAVKRLVMRSSETSEHDQLMIRALLDTMADDSFRGGLADLDEDTKLKLSAIWQSRPSRSPLLRFVKRHLAALVTG